MCVKYLIKLIILMEPVKTGSKALEMLATV